MSSALEENRVCLEINGFQGKTYRKFRKNCRRGEGGLSIYFKQESISDEHGLMVYISSRYLVKPSDAQKTDEYEEDPESELRRQAKT
jgi:hypothetical protein